MKFVFPILLLLLLALLVFVCDWCFKHLLWRLLSHRTAAYVRIGAFVVLWGGIILAIVHGNRVTRFALHTEPVEIASARLPRSFDGFRIAQISDIHLEQLSSERGHEFVNTLVDTLIALRPDAILFTGDLVTLHSAEADAFATTLARLGQSGIPIYSVMGKHAYADYMATASQRWRIADRRRLMDMQRSWGWRLLNNERAIVGRGNDSIQIVGVENIGEPPFSTYGNLAQAMGSLTSADSTFTIVLSHNPTHWRREILPNTRADLTLSGHTHAMQLRVAGWSLVAWRYKEWGGLYTEGAQHLYVNTGIGTVGFPFRIGVPPEITLITLRHKA